MAITEEQRKQVKGQGFLSNKDGEHFSARVITTNGVLKANQIRNLAEAAELYGNGNVSFTSRLTVEIPGIRFDDIEKVQQHVAKESMATGGTGPKVRPIVSCKGTVCQYGLIDTFQLSSDIHKHFYEGYRNVTLPHKFKIGVGGCPNNCIKPNLNDFGVVGQSKPSYDKDTCKNCKSCFVESKCPMKAATYDNEQLSINQNTCTNCGLCIKHCPFKAISSIEKGYKIYFGGLWGKTSRHGTPYKKIVSHFEVFEILEKTILLYKLLAQKGERFGKMLDRIGYDEFERRLDDTAILLQKEQILFATNS